MEVKEEEKESTQSTQAETVDFTKAKPDDDSSEEEMSPEDNEAIMVSEKKKIEDTYQESQ